MNDTISAISTAYGEGGIGIVRMSGSRSYEILSDIFDNIDKVENRKLTYGHIRDPRDGRTVDEVLVAYMKAPHTYTGEDVVEINCHGSMVALRKILDITLKEGASLAEKGEFTKRAFLNGKIDLSQAEAVIDLIKASSSSGYDVALSQLDGSFGRNISEIRQKLVDILVDITVNIDYPDEDIEEIVYENLRENIFKIKEDIDYLISTSDTGRILKDGIKIAIIGKPNVGKSSLMNRLLMENRAIVTDIPGTTRDVIQENMMIRNIPVILIDTAGIRETDDKIEKIGIEKSKETFNDADLILFLLNSGDVITDEDYSIMNRVANKNVLVLLNKSDMDRKIETDRIKEILGDKTFLDTSMETGQGVEELKDIIEKMVYKGNLKQDNSLIVTNARHLNLLRDASAFLEYSLKSIDSNQPLEFIEIDVKNTYDDLGAILGEEVGDDILNEVFSRFCLGK